MNLDVILFYLVTGFLLESQCLSSLPLGDDGDKLLKSPQRCVMERAYKMLGYVCTNMNLKEIPQTLKTSVQVLDLSSNRIRDLYPSSFEIYDDLKFLYIFDNMLQTIEPNTFSHLQKLEALDLSINGLTTIPMEILDLPLLRNLYLNDNDLKHLDQDLALINKPIRAPIQLLNLSKCKLLKIPNFGILPELQMLNISSNSLAHVEPTDFSQFCSLHTISINNTHVPICKCYKISHYLRSRRIILKDGSSCSQNEIEYPNMNVNAYCADDPTNVTNYETEEYNQCLSFVQTKQIMEESKITWLTIAAGIVGFLFVLLVVLYLLHRRSKRKSQKRTEFRELKKNHSSEYVNTDELLSNNKFNDIKS